MDAVDSNFFSTAARQAYNGVKAQLWSAIDSEINLSECDIYRQVPFLLCCAFRRTLNACFDSHRVRTDYNSKTLSYNREEEKRKINRKPFIAISLNLFFSYTLQL